MPRPSVAPPRTTAAALAAALVAALLVLLPGSAAQAAPVLLSQGRPATASSQENGALPASAAVDGDNATRWSSQFADPQWIQVDLGAAASLSQVVLRWETAYAKAYRVELSTDGASWSTAHSTTTGTGGVQTLAISGTARYVRVFGTERATAWGYSLYEFQVYGNTGTGPTLPGGGDLGPNVIVFDPATPNIQGRLDEVFARQESAQFGSGRYQFLFKPGTYNGLNAQIGFYTSISGLGLSPDDTTINGDVTVDAGWFGGNATQNFWRSAENLALNPVNGTDRWAVSQAAPFRRMHVKGGLNLSPRRLRLGLRRIHRRLEDRRPGRQLLPAAVVHPGQLHRRLVQRRLEPGLLGHPGRAGAVLPQRPVHHPRHHPRVAGEALPLSGRLRVQGVRPRQAGERARHLLGQRRCPTGHFASPEPLLRGEAGRERRDGQPGAGPGPAPALHPGRLPPRPDHPGRPPRHGRPRHWASPPSSRTTG
ncbi:hypothetical protein GCM10020254_72690 [Streptomyces goshikiensis]